MSGPVPANATELRAWRDSTLYRLAMRMSRAERTATLARLHALGYADVTLTDTTLLANLDVDGCSITDLAATAGITRQAASQHVAALKREGYVVREADPEDARAMRVQRTELGHALLQDALQIVADLETDYARILGRRQLEQLKALLQTLLAEVDPHGALGPD